MNKTGAFTPGGPTSAGNTTYYLEIVVNNSGNTAAATALGLLSGLTLTVIPAYARDDYTMTANLSFAGAPVKTYVLKDHTSYYSELFLLFAMPFAERDVLPELLGNMSRNLVAQMTADGVFEQARRAQTEVHAPPATPAYGSQG